MDAVQQVSPLCYRRKVGPGCQDERLTKAEDKKHYETERNASYFLWSNFSGVDVSHSCGVYMDRENDLTSNGFQWDYISSVLHCACESMKYQPCIKFDVLSI